MSLDVFSPVATDQNVLQNAARDLPADFSETWDVATRSIAEWHGFANYNNARERALSTYYDDVKRRTGVQLPLYGMGGNVGIEELNEAIAKLPQQGGQPEQSFTPLSEGAINGMALQRMRRAHDDAEAMAHRETTWGGTAGTVLGVLAAGLSDPINVATLPLGGAGNIPVALRALEFGVIAGGSEAVNALSGYRTREAAVPGSSKEIPGEIGAAFLFGSALGAGVGALTKWLGHGARPLPTSLRDDFNAATSELQFNVTNPFPTAAGEAAHRDAVNAAVNSVLRGEPVKAGESFFEAYHGSPHRFDKFDLGQVGTGEGYQAEGHGLYFAENPRVAEQYRERLSRQIPTVNGRVQATGAGKFNIVDDFGVQAGPFDTREQAEISLKGTEGSLYKVKIRADREKFLEFDKPLSEQSQFVQKALLEHSDPAIAGTAEKWGHDTHAMYRRLGLRVGPQEMNDTVGREAAASKALNEAGIPGIRYLDAGSREKGKGTYNYVVFNDKDVEITSRNGKPLTIAEARAADQALAAKAKTPEELAAAGERHLRPETYGEKPDVEAFERMPSAADDAASYWDKRLAAATAEERAALGATDTPGAIARDITPAERDALAADPRTVDAAVHDLDHVLRANPDAEFTTQVRQADGSYQFQTQKLSDVVKEADEFEKAGRELEACLVALEAAE